MEKKQETKKSKSLVKKAKKIRSMIMMTLLCVLMMSAATYAWFTLSNTAKATNLTMTVGDVSGLQIAEDNEGATPSDDAWKAMIDVGKFEGTLLPATTTDGIDILKPKYATDGTVEAVEATNENEKLTKKSTQGSEGYYVEYSFWLRATGADQGTTTVQLDKGENLNGGVYSESANSEGTYSLSLKKGINDVLPSAAVRISLINNGTAKVYEPNTNFEPAAKIYALDKRNVKTAKSSDVQQNVDGTFKSSNSNVLTLNNNEATKITLKLWLEGTDGQCGNDIAAQDIKTQLKFNTVTGTGEGN